MRSPASFPVGREPQPPAQVELDHALSLHVLRDIAYLPSNVRIFRPHRTAHSAFRMRHRRRFPAIGGADPHHRRQTGRPAAHQTQHRVRPFSPEAGQRSRFAMSLTTIIRQGHAIPDLQRIAEPLTDKSSPGTLHGVSASGDALLLCLLDGHARNQRAGSRSNRYRRRSVRRRQRLPSRCTSANLRATIINFSLTRSSSNVSGTRSSAKVTSATGASYRR